MVSSAENTVTGYLASLPPERQAVMRTMRELVRASLPPGYEESMGYGMIAYTVPLARYPDTYNGQPLCYVALAAQKHHYSLYLTCAYQPGSSAGWLAEQFARAGKRLDMGKSCVRFKSLDDLPLPAIGEFIAATPPEKFIATYEAVRAAPRERPARKVSAAGKPSTRKSATRESATGKAATRKSATRESTRRNPRERT